MLFWSHDISFNIDLGLMNPVKKYINFLLENWSSSLNGLNQPYKARPSTIFDKSYAKLSRNVQKNIFYTLIFFVKLGIILKSLVTFFHVQLSDFGIIKWFMSYTQKYMKTWQKSGFLRNAIISKQIKIGASKFDTTILKPGIKLS